MKKCSGWMNIFRVLAVIIVADTGWAGSLNPTNAPGPTMHTLEEIYQKLEILVSPQTLSATTPVVEAGYYAATNLVEVDADLTPANIKTNVTIFGVIGTLSTNVGSAYPAVVPKTGQTNSYASKDDGDLEKGVAWPNQRFTDNGNGTVTDNLTGLLWLTNANAFGGRNWATALTDCATLNSGESGLTDGSVQGDWRLPNAKELYSLIDLGRSSPALPSGHPFTGVQSGASDFYFSSSTYVASTDTAWCVRPYDGYVGSYNKTITFYVWPVRGGQ